MDKQEQIEEMAKDLENTILGLGIHLCRKSAEKLYDLGYRKVPDGATVLLVGKYNQALDEKTIEYFIKHNEQIRKETAEKIFKMLISELESNKFLYGKRIIMEVDVENLAKQYGVEVEE